MAETEFPCFIKKPTKYYNLQTDDKALSSRAFSSTACTFEDNKPFKLTTSS